ncbi:MAG: DUF1573 domain-containing protein [Ignavibacteria bacterium]|nr:DUF1573 domain-containing protein [Ignavibacteria bacterium]
MKRYFVLLLLSFPFLLFAQPKIEIVGGDSYDWGTVKPTQDPLKAKIKIKNVGNELLKITEVKPGCGCTTAPLDKNELKPGEEATLDVTLRITGTSGNVVKSIRIASNDPNNPNKYLYLKANVFYPISITPTSYFTFNEMTVGQEAQAKVTLKNNTNENITLSEVQVVPENLNVNLPKKLVLKAGESYDIVAKVVPDKKGYFNCSVKIKTNNPDQKEIIIPGYGNVKESPLFNN